MGTITIPPKWKVFREYNELKYEPVSISSGRIVSTTVGGQWNQLDSIYSFAFKGDPDYEKKYVSTFDPTTASFVPIEKISDLPDDMSFTNQSRRGGNYLIAYNNENPGVTLDRRFRIYYGCKIRMD
jgi:hypothetical protein